MSTPTIFILLPVHNRVRTTLNFIRQLKDQTYLGFHLVLIDDGSNDGTAEQVSRELPGASVIRGNGNLWWAGSLQKGYAWVKAHCQNGDDIVLTINDDTHFSRRFLENAVQRLEGRDRIALCAQCIGLHGGRLEDAGIFWDWRYGMRLATHDGEINCFSTRGLFMRVRDFLSLGPFHTLLLPHYLSDYEFTMRAPRKGIRMITDPSVVVMTDESPAGISQPDTSSVRKYFSQYFSKRNYRQPIYVFFFILFACDNWTLKVKNWLDLNREFGRRVWGARVCFGARSQSSAASPREQP